ncbi:DNA-directed RNA polymerase III 47 kDa polypeptide [Mesorhizobium escarrei]|uniref:DNA-directed RNA polymerase III 47 kDa polypeptide n=1 Tax=Mesorhizobium escarrei TaxID=666018 RepID=A0ABM9ECP5_9HYPH|nr:DNA-directed RNA polymerase III 47 kDa polypeptide [Mesorhizobium escarrei]
MPRHRRPAALAALRARAGGYGRRGFGIAPRGLASRVGAVSGLWGAGNRSDGSGGFGRRLGGGNRAF